MALSVKLSREKFAVNRGVVIIKLCYFCFTFGISIIFPYLTLQMRNIGLTLDDVSFTYGVIPLLTIFAAPATSLIGDKIGYKVLYIANALVMAAVSTCFDLTPRYSDKFRAPTALVYQSNGSESKSSYDLLSVSWPMCGMEMTTRDCEESPPFADHAFADIGPFLSCANDDNFVLNEGYQFHQHINLSDTANGTFCLAETLSDTVGSGFLRRCYVNDTYPGLESCRDTQGSHAVTFGVYFALRFVFQWTLGSAFSLLDGTSLRLAEQHSSDYSYINFYNQLASLLAAVVPGFAIKDPEEGSGDETDYSLSFYICDGFVLLSCFFALFLTITMEQTGERMVKSLKKIFSKPALNLFALSFFSGMSWGINDTYLYVYLQEDLKASSALISYFVIVASFSKLVANLFAKQIIDKFGEMNLIFLGIFLEGLRFFTYSLIRTSPPYYAYALHALDGIVLAVPWVATMHYGYKITPPDLVATMVATITCIQFVIGKGLGSFVGGQLISEDHGIMDTGDLFQYTFYVTTVGAVACLVWYHLMTKNRHEKEVLEQKEILIAKMREAEKAKAVVNEGGDNIRRIDAFAMALEMSHVERTHHESVRQMPRTKD